MAAKVASQTGKKGSRIQRIECVSLLAGKRHRRGKHQALTQDVLKHLETLEDNWAVQIQLRDISAKTLRSAVFRAASAQGIKIVSFSDQDHLYILTKPRTL